MANARYDILEEESKQGNYTDNAVLHAIGPDDHSDSAEDLSEEEISTGILREMVEIRPTADVPDAKMTPFRLSMLLLRYQLANWTANDRNPLLAQPWRETMDWGIVSASREAGVAGYYGFSCDWNDIVEYLRSIGGGNAGLGILAGTAKILIASLPCVLVGFGIGALMSYFAAEIAAGPAFLQVLTSPTVSRLISGVLSPFIYLATRKYIVDKIFPPPDFKFNQTPSLHPLQKLSLLGFRIYDAVVNFELIRILMMAFGGESLVNSLLFPAGVVLVDQLLKIVDQFAFGRDTFDTSFPFENELKASRKPPINIEIDLPDDIEQANEQYLQDQIKWESFVVSSWYAARMAAVFATTIGLHLFLSQYVGNPELLDGTTRLVYNSAILTAGVLMERLIEDGIPWIYHHGRETASTVADRVSDGLSRAGAGISHAASSISSSMSSLFARNNAPAANEEARPLLDEHQEQSPTVLSRAGAFASSAWSSMFNHGAVREVDPLIPPSVNPLFYDEKIVIKYEN